MSVYVKERVCVRVQACEPFLTREGVRVRVSAYAR